MQKKEDINNILNEADTESMNFEQAIDKALDFVKRNGYPYARLIKANKKKDNSWVVVVDVGMLNPLSKTVKIAHNGVVIGFE